MAEELMKDGQRMNGDQRMRAMVLIGYMVFAAALVAIVILAGADHRVAKNDSGDVQVTTTTFCGK